MRHIVGAMGEGWRATPSILAPEAQDAQYRLWGPVGGSIVNSLFSLAGAVPAATNALMYGGAELANQVTGDPRAGRDALMLGRTALTPERRCPSCRSASRRAARQSDDGSSVHGRAERAAQSRPQPMSEAESGIARTHAQLGFGPDNPPPPPDMTATPADRAPAFVPRVNIDPLTGQTDTARFPSCFACKQPSMPLATASRDRNPASRQAAAPPVDRVPPGAAGPRSPGCAGTPMPQRGTRPGQRMLLSRHQCHNQNRRPSQVLVNAPLARRERHSPMRQP